MVEDLAARYYSYFFFRSLSGSLHLALSETAPPELKALVQDMCGADPSQERLVSLYDCLCSLAGQEASVQPESRDKELYAEVHNYLQRQDMAY